MRDIPVIALLTCEALQVIDIATGPHHHFKGRYHLVAGSTESSATKQPAENGKDSFTHLILFLILVLIIILLT